MDPRPRRRGEPPALAAVHRDDRPGPARRRDGHPVEEMGGSPVRPVRVLHEHDHPLGQQASGQLDERVGNTVGPELGFDAVGLRCRGNVHLGDVRKQGGKGQQVRRGLFERVEQGAPHLLRHATGDTEQRPDGVPQDPVGARRTVGLGAQHDPVVGCNGLQHLLCQPGLAQAGGPLDRQHASGSAQCLVDDLPCSRELLVPSEHRQPARRHRLPRSDLLSDGVDRQRDRLALHREGAGRCHREPRVRLLQDGRVGVDGTEGSGRHDPSRGVRRVPHGGVGGTLVDADLGSEDVAPVHAQLQRERQAGVRDAAQRPQHATLVVLARDRDTRPEEELAAVGVDVRGEQGDALHVERLLDAGDELVQRVAEGLVPLLVEDRVRPREADERDGGHPVFGVRRAGGEVLAELDRKERSEQAVVPRRYRRVGRGARVDSTATQQQLAVGTGAGGPG